MQKRGRMSSWVSAVFCEAPAGKGCSWDSEWQSRQLWERRQQVYLGGHGLEAGSPGVSLKSGREVFLSGR